MDLLRTVPELPLIVAAALFALVCVAFRRVAATIVLVAALLFVGSMLLNWPGDQFVACYPSAGVMILRW